MPHCPDFSEEVTLRQCGGNPLAASIHPDRKD